MLNKKGERELAYIVKVDAVEPIEGYDKIAFATVGGWHCVVGADMKAGDLAIYIEIDSLVPSNDERFAFCEKYKYRIRTQRYCKGTRISQGLLVPLTDFPEFKDCKVGTFVTDKLHITYYEAEDRQRKGKEHSKQEYKPFFNKIKRHFPFKQLLRIELGRKILFAIFGIKKKKKKWPEFMPHSDEERVQNMTWILKNKAPFIVSEKIDGCSSGFGICKKPFGGYQYYVCSRNVVLDSPNSKAYYDFNVWYEMYEKYHIKDFLTDYIKKIGATWVYLQGESFGAGIQKRDYSLKDHDFRAFALNDSTRKCRCSYVEMAEILDRYDIPTVPILNKEYILPDSVEELLQFAQDASKIDGKPREGIVLQKAEDPSFSFKAVDPEFLMKYHG